jgi:hypothetical protein
MKQYLPIIQDYHNLFPEKGPNLMSRYSLFLHIAEMCEGDDYYGVYVNKYLGSFSERSFAEEALAQIDFEKYVKRGDKDDDYEYNYNNTEFAHNTFGFIYNHYEDVVIDTNDVDVIGRQMADMKHAEWVADPEGGIAYYLKMQKELDDQAELAKIYYESPEYLLEQNKPKSPNVPWHSLSDRIVDEIKIAEIEKCLKTLLQNYEDKV